MHKDASQEKPKLGLVPLRVSYWVWGGDINWEEILSQERGGHTCPREMRTPGHLNGEGEPADIH